MEILNIGPMELVWILLLMFVLIGPQEMIRTAQRAGALIRRASQSPYWKAIKSSVREISDLPTRLAREAGFEELDAEIRKQNRIRIETMKRPANYPRKPGEVRSSGTLANPAPASFRTDSPINGNKDEPSSDIDRTE